ncbi:hypothetical protein [Aromatoleum evansii]|uniref:hypothetical protein n=1 Tax=Aromatoleum evansii TaxID=59406 RepID=UPI00145CFB8E|nr:hypothetical protein [Aromatoleum evansii]NMG32533.1 hypothetical protein [Aromatoleum evansii]
MMVMKTPESGTASAVGPLFPLGRVVATPGALRLLEAYAVSPKTYLARHAAGDWGEVCAADQHANLAALREEGRLLSAYRLPGGERVWVITECDRSVTTLLRPEEY